jgi:hypothetical protein
MTIARQLLERPWTLAVALLLALPILSCSDDDGDDRLRELRRNQRLWQSRSIEDYQFVQQRSCFCDPGSLKPIRVEVREGQVVRVEDLDTGVPLPPSRAMTVEGLFDRIEQVIHNDYEYLETTYDPGLGFPVELSTNPGGGIQDAGWSMSSSEMTLLQPAVRCDPPPTLPPCDCPAEFPAMAYRYTAWDDSGNVVATGCATLTFTARPGTDPPAYQVAGSRCLSVRCLEDVNSAHQGVNSVSGELKANGEFFADLNSGWYDNNIFLLAMDVDSWTSQIGGRWGESQFNGSVAHGTFLLDRTSQ